jgi:predicted HicB family RNase H-like nuclease
MSRPVGRPRVPKKLAKGSLLSVRFSGAERRKIDLAAEKDGVSVSEWSRRALLAAAEQRSPSNPEPQAAPSSSSR